MKVRMKSLERRIERLEERVGVNKEAGPKAIEVFFVETNWTVSSSMLIDLTRGGQGHETGSQAHKGA